MSMRNLIGTVLAGLILLINHPATAAPVKQQHAKAAKRHGKHVKHKQAESAPHDLKSFIAEMAHKHHFARNRLEQMFQQVAMQQTILERIAKPAEAKPWHVYRKIFITESRIQNGLTFWREHANVLAMVQDRYGVPPEIIVGILGVETGYGRNTGGFRVIDALYTLAFGYPKRAEFFRKELEEYLLLCREEGMDPLEAKGSYAGAMGLSQFMPSSFRHFAADFDGDNHRDIWHNANDAIASVANYFTQHGWQRGGLIIMPTTVQGDGYQQWLDSDLKPRHSLSQLQSAGVQIPPELIPGTTAKLIALEQPEGRDYWLGLHNFYVITRYNHSPLYAMAVYELGQAIKARL